MLEEIRNRQGNHAHADADGDEHEVVVSVKFDLSQSPDAAGDNHAEHGDARAAENGVGNAGYDGSHLREQPQQDEDDGQPSSGTAPAG